jgi:hypothetical protein
VFRDFGDDADQPLRGEYRTADDNAFRRPDVDEERALRGADTEPQQSCGPIARTGPLRKREQRTQAIVLLREQRLRRSHGCQ